MTGMWLVAVVVVVVVVVEEEEVVVADGHISWLMKLTVHD